MTDKDQQKTGEQKTDPKEQLFDTIDSDTSADVSSDEKTKVLPDTETKIERPADIERGKQVQAWAKRITEGKLTLEELPKDNQWLKPYILEWMDVQTQTPEIEKVVEQKLLEREESKKFSTLKEQLNSMRLSGIQKAEVNDEYADLVTRGVPKSIALEKAMRISGIPVSREDQERVILRQRMATPASGQPRRDKADVDLEDEDFFDRPEKERVQHLFNLVRGQGHR